MGRNASLGRLSIIGQLAFVLFLAGASAAHAATFNLLYNFAGGTSDGGGPTGFLTNVGSLLYGMTSGGGPASAGTIFAFNPATNAESVVYSFKGSPYGSNPVGSLIQSAIDPNILYGTTAGTLFSFDIATNSETPLYSFGTTVGDGGSPSGGVIQSGNMLYGFGGNATFVFNTNTNTESTLPSLGYGGYGTPVLVGNVLYGPGSAGGTSSAIYSYNLGTGIETELQSFSGSAATSLTVSGNLLYGAGGGTIFSYDTNTETLQTLISGIKAGPGPLLLNGSTLYGKSAMVGDMFAYDIDTDQFTVLCHGGDGFGGLALIGSTLYGTTSQGGTNGDGVIFSLTLPDPDGTSSVPEPGMISIMVVVGGSLLLRGEIKGVGSL